MRKKKLLETKYIAFVASSIDGRIAKDGYSGTDWTSKEDWNFFQNSLIKMDVVVVGHNTFKVSAKRLRQRNTVVLTTKVAHLKIEGTVTFFNPKRGNPKSFLEKSNYKKVAILGGGQVYDFCLRNKMLDELFVTIEPYIFTAGVSMFSGDRFKKNRFILQSIKRFNKKGSVLLKYKNAS